VLQTGDTVWVQDGTYYETVDFWHVPAGTGGRTTVRAVPGHYPVIDGGGASGFLVQAGETPLMTFQGLAVRGRWGAPTTWARSNSARSQPAAVDPAP
jgi:hypothetical protein